MASVSVLRATNREATPTMLNVGRIHDHTCRGTSRRELLQIGSVGVLGLSLPHLLQLQAAEVASERRARAVIWLWLWGGPSHLDTFDMKPDAPVEYRGPFRPVATNVPGIAICELLPHLAAKADKYTILRSLHHESPDHGIAGTIGLTRSKDGGVSLGGQTLPGTLQPAHGALVSRILPTSGATAGVPSSAAPARSSALPSFVTLGGHLHQGHRPIAGEGGGVLGRLYDPFRLDYDPKHGVKIPQFDLIEGLSLETLVGRRKLLQAFDDLRNHVEASSRINQLDHFYQQAFDLLTSPAARRVFHLEEEPDALRSRYGRFRFGQCCLLARRLVESGVPFVQVNWSSHVEPIEDAGDGGWDMHDRNFIQLQDRHCWMLDQAVSALLDDLSGRGMLDETLVVAVGEFGRTPKINAKAGRDHWNQCYSALVAGGGLRPGQVIGASDPRAEYPVTRPLTPADLAATVLHQLGIGTQDLTALALPLRGEVIEELV
jgi:hypothetical protein